MSDYIKREDAIDAVRASIVLQEAIDAVDNVPSADVVEVVRCKECKYWHKNTEFCDKFSHMGIAQRMLADDFCSLGERREIDTVRCKDCKHGEYREDFNDYLCCEDGISVHDAEWYCADG